MKINKTILYIHNLEQMINFYGEKLGFPILEKSPKGFQIAVGNSILAFELISPTIYKQKQSF
ncbi:VOC family protein [Ureibacillus sp. 179-F W5.1 NHS]|uniref:VOC family protein n=1 Tax=Ureibacillus sp. 179-F W5.1 NHS TaxID=3374297 RepID=UPI003879852C